MSEFKQIGQIWPDGVFVPGVLQPDKSVGAALWSSHDADKPDTLVVFSTEEDCRQHCLNFGSLARPFKFTLSNFINLCETLNRDFGILEYAVWHYKDDEHAIEQRGLISDLIAGWRTKHLTPPSVN